MKVSAVVVAAGASERMNGVDKLEYIIDGCTVLEHSVKRLLENGMINEVVVAVRKSKIEQTKRLLEGMKTHKPVTVVGGGDTRFDSVQRGIAAAVPDADYYCIHDAARPFVSDELITKTIEAAVVHGAAVGGTKLSDTVKTVNSEGFVTETLERQTLRAVGTPQVFKAEVYRRAVCDYSGEDTYDDCEIIEKTGGRVVIIEGEPENIKITTPRDLDIINQKKTIIRVGHGYDVHRFSDSRKLILGGVGIPFEIGLLGHSDADVLTHAIVDALLGASALGDIGRVFPDDRAEYKNICSLILLERTANMIKQAGFTVGNIDATIVCQKPKLKEYIDEMRGNIALAAGADAESVNIKATTEEGLGFTGLMQGIAAHAVVLLSK